MTPTAAEERTEAKVENTAIKSEQDRLIGVPLLSVSATILQVMLIHLIKTIDDRFFGAFISSLFNNTAWFFILAIIFIICFYRWVVFFTESVNSKSQNNLIRVFASIITVLSVLALVATFIISSDIASFIFQTSISGIVKLIIRWFFSLNMLNAIFAAIPLFKATSDAPTAMEGKEHKGNMVLRRVAIVLFFLGVFLTQFIPDSGESYKRTLEGTVDAGLSMVKYEGDKTTLNKVQISTAKPSSEAKDSDSAGNPISFGAKNVLEDSHTPWMEGVFGNGTGELDGTINGDPPPEKQYIKLSLREKTRIDVLGLHLGYTGEKYKRMNRPKALLFQFSDGSITEYIFDDIDQMQFVQLTPSVEADWIQLTLLSVYEGTSVSDAGVSQTCITRVEAFQIREP